MVYTLIADSYSGRCRRFSFLWNKVKKVETIAFFLDL